MWNKFLTTNTPLMRVSRTIFQGVIGVIIANLDSLIDVQAWIPVEYKALTVALIMAILSPIMAEIGKYTLDKEEILVDMSEDEVGAIIEDVNANIE